eukprot:g2862.t1
MGLFYNATTLSLVIANLAILRYFKKGLAKRLVSHSSRMSSVVPGDSSERSVARDESEDGSSESIANP